MHESAVGQVRQKAEQELSEVCQKAEASAHQRLSQQKQLLVTQAEAADRTRAIVPEWRTSCDDGRWRAAEGTRQAPFPVLCHPLVSGDAAGHANRQAEITERP